MSILPAPSPNIPPFCRFSIFILGLFLTLQMFVSLFKCVTAYMPSAAAAQGFAMGVMALSFCFSGFLVTKSTIPDYFIWIYWVIPYSWVLRMFAINEFTSPSYDTLVACRAGQCRLGDVILEQFAMQNDRKWILFGFIYLIVATVLCQVFYMIGMERLRLGVSRPRRVAASGSTLMRLACPGKVSAGPTAAMQRQISAEGVGSAERAFAVLKGLSVQPRKVSLALRNLGYTVTLPGKKEKRRLLSNIDAYFEPGTMTALMGSSGAGKTTLMDVIAGRKTAGSVEGEILVNGNPQNLATFARVSGYCEQTDIHVPSQTVLEALRFSALHRLPRSLPDAEKEKMVQAVADLIELRPLLHRAIGEKGASAGEGLSVEQRKRVTIGVEMVANPSVLFLDEPTSGLDSRAARIVMRAIRRVAASGRTVVCTIHQPSFEIFSMFDRLLLLRKGGRIVFNGSLGPTGISEVTHDAVNTGGDMVKYFEGCSPETPRYRVGQNPAEYMLEVIGAGTTSILATATDGVDYVGCYEKSEMAAAVAAHVQNVAPGAELSFAEQYSAPVGRQLWMSTRRWLQTYWRHVNYNFTRIVIVGIVALLFSLCIVGAEIVDTAHVQSFNGALFAGVFFSSAIQATMTVGILGNSKELYYKEIDARTYHPFAYLFGLALTELPWLLLLTLLNVAVFYPITGLYNDAATVAEYATALFLAMFMFNCWGQMLSAILPTTQMASLLCGASMGILNLYSGFFMPGSEIPWPWKVFFYAAPARFALKSTMPPQFFCDRSCIGDVQCNSLLPSGLAVPFGETAAGQRVCAQGVEAAGGVPCAVSSLAALGASGPGCGLITDSANQVLLKAGKVPAATALAESYPGLQGATVTVWDFWSITTESNYDNRYEYMLGMVACAVAFRVVTLLCLRFVKHIQR